MTNTRKTSATLWIGYGRTGGKPSTWEASTLKIEHWCNYCAGLQVSNADLSSVIKEQIDRAFVVQIYTNGLRQVTYKRNDLTKSFTKSW